VIRKADLLVLGAGPAGCHAALAGAEAGLDVVLLDEQDTAGGQGWRAPLAGLGMARKGADALAGDAMRQRLARSGIECRFGRRVWSVGGRFRLDAMGPDGAEAFEAERLIAATGAHERVVPFPGWTLPGVIGLAGATVLLKAQAVLPGKRVVVAGAGPLLFAVAAGIIAKGGEVAAIADMDGRLAWMKRLPGLARRLDLLREGLGWSLSILGARVPLLAGHGIRRALGENQLETVVIGPVDGAGAPVGGAERTFDCDALAIGHGLVPGGEAPKILRAAHVFDRQRGGWVPTRDAYGRCSIAGLYACGDGAGIAGARPSAAAGTLAGLAAAHDAGRLNQASFAALAEPAIQQLSAYRPFAAAVTEAMALRGAQVAAIPPETVVCRCEDVTRAEIDAAVDAGATDINQMKHFTRCGMGPCQGRMCGDIAAELVAQRRGVGREAVGFWTQRVPLRPVALDQLLGRFDYADIPIPPPAPL
jgi:NADPH-dependent 2,4-dienoyl-CoA reductase/sulfur reductase-like enzyme